MKKCLLAIAGIVLAASSAQASILGDALSFDGVTDLLDDNSAGLFLDLDSGDPGGDPFADVVFGVVQIDNVGPDGSPESTLAKTGGSIFAIYSFALGAPTPLAGGGLEFATATAGAGAHSVDSLLAGADFSLLDTKPGRAGIDTAIALVEIAGDKAVADWSWDGTSLLFEGAAISSSLQVSLTAGFDGVDDLHTVGVADLGGIIGLVGGFTGAYTVTADIFGAGIQYEELLNEDGDYGEIIINNGGIAEPDASVSANGWNFEDSGTYQINPVPEPTSVAVWALIGMGGLGIRRRRRQS